MKYKLDTERSKISWMGFQPANRLGGALRIRSGYIETNEYGRLDGGEFEIDMQSLEVTDDALDKENQKKLAGHLKSADFFDAEKYPTVDFKITNVTPAEESYKYSSEAREDVPDVTHEITGELTVRGKAEPVRFPAHIEEKEEEVTATSRFKIDRERWGVSYMSEESFGEKKILPDIEIGLDLVFKK